MLGTILIMFYWFCFWWALCRRGITAAPGVISRAEDWVCSSPSW